MTADYSHDPAGFFDAYIKVNELGQPFMLMDHQREILPLAFDFDEDGRLPWDTIIYSCTKKSGKTTINGGITTWWAYTQEPPNECLILANDAEQAASRVFKTVSGIIRNNPELSQSAKLEVAKITLSNGTNIPWLSCDYAGSAGSNHGLSSWDELWGYSSEGSRRLWEEMTPVPTRTNSIRFITTYAGFENESNLLRELYLLGVDQDEHPDGKGERLHPTLPIYCNRDARSFCYWDHEPRMVWQTPAYSNAQRRNLRPNTYLRLHENRWTVSEARFIQPEMWDVCVNSDLRPLLPTREVSILVGVDGSMKHDYAAVVGVARIDNRLQLAFHRIWKPSPSEPLDIEATIEAFLREVCEQYRVTRILFDPYQLHQTGMKLKAAGLPIHEFPQSTANTMKMGTGLFDLIKGKNLLPYPDEELREQALNCVAVETAQGFRLAKERASKQIDAIVALSMACVAALDQPLAVPFDLLSNGQWISGRSVEPRQPAQPSDADVLSVPKSLLTDEQRERRAGLMAQEQRRSSPVEREIGRSGYWWPRT